jgi:VanZ family protein
MISVMGSIFLLSHQPGTTLQLAVPPGADKLGHAVLYALLAGTALFALLPVPPQRTLRTGILVVLICFLYGIGDEVHQAFVPGREASVGDLLADVAGAAIVVALWLRRTVCRQPTTP